jgi:hypothetical protein
MLCTCQMVACLGLMVQRACLEAEHTAGQAAVFEQQACPIMQPHRCQCQWLNQPAVGEQVPQGMSVHGQPLHAV